MKHLFKLLLALTLLLTGGLRTGFAVSGTKRVSTFSLTAAAHQKAPDSHICNNPVSHFKSRHLHAENLFHKSLLELDDDDDDDENNQYRKLLASLPAALPAKPFIDLHLAPGFFHQPRKLIELHNRDARAYAGKPVYVLFGTFLI